MDTGILIPLAFLAIFDLLPIEFDSHFVKEGTDSEEVLLDFPDPLSVLDFLFSFLLE